MLVDTPTSHDIKLNITSGLLLALVSTSSRRLLLNRNFFPTSSSGSWSPSRLVEKCVYLREMRSNGASNGSLGISVTTDGRSYRTTRLMSIRIGELQVDYGVFPDHLLMCLFKPNNAHYVFCVCFHWRRTKLFQFSDFYCCFTPSAKSHYFANVYLPESYSVSSIRDSLISHVQKH